jgi:caffeoyl-CoA O-methyltransferase
MHLLTSEAIHAYCEKMSDAESNILKDLSRQTHLKTELPIMLSGHLQGKVLSMISHMIQPKRILELGTFTGYSAICLAEGLTPDGLLITIDINEELKDFCEAYFVKAGLEKKIKMLVGSALDILPQLDEMFDLIFIDADKVNYGNYLDIALSKLRIGGFILADNVLYNGEVIHEKKMSKNANAMHAYNQKINETQCLVSVLLPLRDGIMISRKKY